MGILKYTEFKAELKLQLGQRTDLDSLSGVDYIGQWVNRAYLTLTTKNKIAGVSRRFYFPELETSTASTTTDGDSTINVPSDCMVIRHIWDSTNDKKLRNISFDKYLSYPGRADTTKENEPTQWVRNEDYIYLYPTPDDSYTLYIYYRKRPTVMSDDNDTTDIGAEWDEAILQLAVIQSLRRLKQYDQAKNEENAWEDLVRGIMEVYYQEELDSKEYVRIDPAYRNSLRS